MNITSGRLLRVNVALVLLAASCVCGCQQKSEKALANDAIHAAFRRFREAVAIANGDAAVRELSAESIRYYDRLRKAALLAPEDELRQASVDFRLAVLLLRGRMTEPELSTLDGRGMAVRYIRERWINSEHLAEISLANVIHTERGAEARFADKLGLTSARLTFRREADGWKFDLSAAAWMQRRVLEQQMESRDLSADELLAAILHEAVGDRPVAELWKPLRDPLHVSGGQG